MDCSRQLLVDICPLTSRLQASFDFEKEKKSAEIAVTEARMQLKMEQERSHALEQELHSVARSRLLSSPLA